MPCAHDCIFVLRCEERIAMASKVAAFSKYLYLELRLRDEDFWKQAVRR